MLKVAVLVPCYNEEKTIKKVVTDWRKELPDARIFVYDNNSSDNTAKIAEKAGAIVVKERMQGKGNVVRRMFQDIDAECYILVDGDDTYPSEQGSEFVRLVLEERVDMVVGDRLSSTYFTENKRLFHNSGNSVVRRAINAVFNSDIKDVMTGYRAFSYRFAKSFPVLSQGFEIETEMTIHAIDKNMSIENVVVEYRDRPSGSESKLNTISDGIKVLLTIIKLASDYKPILFFGVLSLILFIISVVPIVSVIVEFLNTGLVLRFPTLIAFGFIGIISILLLFTGLILQSLKRSEKREFEYRLQTINYQYKILHKKTSRRKKSSS